MSMCGEIENTSKEIDDLKAEHFDISFASPFLEPDQRAERLDKVRKKLLEATQRLNSLLTAANVAEGTHKGQT